MTITGTIGTRAVSKHYPVDDGIIAETTTQKGHVALLELKEESLLKKEDLTGLR